MKLLYDKNGLPHAKKLRDERFTWLKEIGAVDLSDTSLSDEGFLFAYGWRPALTTGPRSMSDQ